MARIPDTELARLADARGVKLECGGADPFGLCPFREDREPSLVIMPEKNLWHARTRAVPGGRVGDLWVMRAEGVGFRHAVSSASRGHLFPIRPVFIAPDAQTPGTRGGGCRHPSRR